MRRTAVRRVSVSVKRMEEGLNLVESGGHTSSFVSPPWSGNTGKVDCGDGNTEGRFQPLGMDIGYPHFFKRAVQSLASDPV